MPHRRRSSMMAGMAGGRASRRNSHRSKRRRSNRGSTPSVDADPKTAHPTTMLPPPPRRPTTTTTTTTTTMRSHGCHSCRVRRICVPIGIWPIRPRRCSPGNAGTRTGGRRTSVCPTRDYTGSTRGGGGDEDERGGRGGRSVVPGVCVRPSRWRRRRGGDDGMAMSK